MRVLEFCTVIPCNCVIRLQWKFARIKRGKIQELWRRNWSGNLIRLIRTGPDCIITCLNQIDSVFRISFSDQFVRRISCIFPLINHSNFHWNQTTCVLGDFHPFAEAFASQLRLLKSWSASQFSFQNICFQKLQAIIVQNLYTIRCV